MVGWYNFWFLKKMCVAEGVHEVARLQPAHLRHHHGQQRIAGDIERYAEEDVGAALVELARQFSICDIKLEEGMAGRERHAVQLAHVPGRDDDAARIGIVFDLLHRDLDLVDHAAIDGFPRAPLLAVHRAKIAVLVRPFVPDTDAVFLQIFGIGAALQKPQQFVDDGLQVALLGGDQRETLRQIEAHLVAEHAGGAGAGAVGFCGAVVQHVLHQVEVLAHVNLNKINSSHREHRVHRESGDAPGFLCDLCVLCGKWFLRDNDQTHHLSRTQC